MGALRAFKLAKSPALPLQSEHQSCVMKVLSREFDADAGKREGRRILDLGASVSSNVEFYSTFAAHIHIEDLASSLLGGENANNSERAAILNEAAPFRQDVGIDLIMCWDLFNYCSGAEAKLLGRRLAECSKPGTKLFVIVGTQPTIPNLPRTFRITQERRIVYETSTFDTRPCPRYTTQDMSRFLPGFTRVRSFLLRNGMEEQLFVFK